MAKTGRYGGTYAQKDIAFEFGSWLSAEFKLYNGLPQNKRLIQLNFVANTQMKSLLNNPTMAKLK